MVVSGIVVLAFIIFHLLHFTGRKFNPQFPLLKNDPLNHYDVYSMMVYGFQNVYVSSFYIIALFLLTLHLTHGAAHSGRVSLRSSRQRWLSFQRLWSLN